MQYFNTAIFGVLTSTYVRLWLYCVKAMYKYKTDQKGNNKQI